MQKDGKGKKDMLFDKVHSKMDVHSYRRFYAKELFKEVSANRQIRNKILKNYLQRHEYKTIRVDGEKVTKEIQNLYFKPKRTKEKYIRDDL